MEKVLITLPDLPLEKELKILEIAISLNFKIHIRKPNIESKVLLPYLKSLPLEIREISTLHYYGNSAKELDFLGFHFSKIHYKKIINEENKLTLNSTSFHSLEELEKKKEYFDYAFCSPVYSSISKNNHKPSFEWDVNKYKQDRIKLYALGGVIVNKIEDCKRRGFDGVAVLGAVWKNKTTKESISELIKIKEECDRLS